MTMKWNRKLSWLRLVVTLLICLVAAPGSLHREKLWVDGSATVKKAPPQRDITLDRVLISYCTSCGYQQSFAQVKQYLEDRYPHLIDRVYGTNHDTEPWKKVLAQLAGYAQIATMVTMVAGDRLFAALGLDPAILEKFTSNRLACFAAIFMLGSVSQSLTSTGAFEIYFNDELLFSKLQRGRWPSLDELGTIFDSYLGDLVQS